MPASDLRTAMAGSPGILVSTPVCVTKCLSLGVVVPASISHSVEILVLDEADLLLSYGFEDDLKALTAFVPRRCQCLLMSATSKTGSADVEKLKRVVLHNPFILTLPEVGEVKDDVIPKNVQQYWLELVHKKVLVFTNTIDMGFRLKLFLEKFRIKSAVLNAKLPQNPCLHILEEFNAGLFDYLIAVYDSETKEKEHTNRESNAESRNSKRNRKPKLDAEFGVVRGIDFKSFYTVINFEMPPSVSGYVHRIGCTRRAYSSGASISLVSLLDNGDYYCIEAKIHAEWPLACAS